MDAEPEILTLTEAELARMLQAHFRRFVAAVTVARDADARPAVIVRFRQAMRSDYSDVAARG